MPRAERFEHVVVDTVDVYRQQAQLLVEPTLIQQRSDVVPCDERRLARELVLPEEVGGLQPFDVVIR